MESKKNKCYIYYIAEDVNQKKYLRIVYKEFDDEVSLNKYVEENCNSDVKFAKKIEDIDTSQFKQDYEEIVLASPGILYKSIAEEANEENIKIDEIISIYNYFSTTNKNFIIDSSDVFNSPRDDYYYDTVTAKLLSNYDKIKEPAKIKCRKDRQSGDDYHIADIKTIKETNEAIDLALSDIQQYGFSPLENIIAAFLIAEKLVPVDFKKFHEDTNNVGSDIYDAIYTNSIKCAGHVDIFVRILKKMGIDAKLEPMITGTGAEKGKRKGVRHATSIVHIEDEKYHISGDYQFDITPIAANYLGYMKNKEVSQTSFFENLTLNGALEGAQLFGRGKDGLDAYKNMYNRNIKLIW